MAESKLVQLYCENSSFDISNIVFTYVCIQHAKPWLHSDIRSCCCRAQV